MEIFVNVFEENQFSMQKILNFKYWAVFLFCQLVQCDYCFIALLSKTRALQAQLATICSKSTKKTVEQIVKYVQS